MNRGTCDMDTVEMGTRTVAEQREIDRKDLDYALERIDRLVKDTASLADEADRTSRELGRALGDLRDALGGLRLDDAGIRESLVSLGFEVPE
jgi:ParB-like chromosome segregation protein Spo0J